MCWLDMLKSKKRPKYRNDSPISTQGIRTPLINSFGKYWTDLVHSFRIPKVEHLSTLIIMFDQLHQIINLYYKVACEAGV